jgi:hypothetical protein
MNVAIVIVVALFTSVTAPLFLNYLTQRDRRAEKEAEWERQDEVAQRLLDAQKETIKATDAVKKEAAAQAEIRAADNKAIGEKLEVIRVDVNSNMTAAKQEALDSTEAQLVLMREVVDMKRAQGKEPSSESLAAIKAAEDRINEMKAELKDRLTHTAEAAEQAAVTTTTTVTRQ